MSKTLYVKRGNGKARFYDRASRSEIIEALDLDYAAALKQYLEIVWADQGFGGDRDNLNSKSDFQHAQLIVNAALGLEGEDE